MTHMIPRAALALLLCLALFSPACPAGHEAASSPRGQSLQTVLNIINGAKYSIRVAAYAFTSKPIAEALRDARKRGLDVKVVADQKTNSGKDAVVTFLAGQGVPVRLNGKHALHHNTYMIVDGRHIRTDSFNCSAAAENVLVARDTADLAPLYEAEWWRLWEEGEDVKAR
jgi:phosphatidylserine/phosphatidylglycerophosphate/cardiolipin synthase-like enzyme